MANIFISHASADRHLALTIKRLLLAVLNGPRQQMSIFCSSDVGDIEGGKEWLPQIMKNLSEAKVCVSVMTPQSVHFSPWTICETGGAYLKHAENPAKFSVFMVSAYGIASTSIAQPFQALQSRSLAKGREVIRLCKEIANALGIKPKRIPRVIVGELVNEAGKGSEHWANVTSTLIGHRQDSSPFNFDSLLRHATNDVFSAGFNLRTIATSKQRMREAMSFLVKSPSTRIRFLISDPRKQHHFRAWKLVGPSYLRDLRDAIQGFRAWRKEAKRQNVSNRLEIKITHFVATSIVCADAESSRAQLIVTPVVFGRPLSADRPHLVLTRHRQPTAFSYYWDIYKEFFERALPLESWRTRNQ